MIGVGQEINKQIGRAFIALALLTSALGFSLGVLAGRHFVKREKPVPKDPDVHLVTCMAQNGYTTGYEVKGHVKIWRDGEYAGASAGCDADQHCDFLITSQIKCWVQP